MSGTEVLSLSKRDANLEARSSHGFARLRAACDPFHRRETSWRALTNVSNSSVMGVPEYAAWVISMRPQTKRQNENCGFTRKSVHRKKLSVMIATSLAAVRHVSALDEDGRRSGIDCHSGDGYAMH